MNATLRLHDTAHLTGLERKRRIFEWLLHLSPREPAQVATFGVRTTIRMFLCQCGEFRGVPCDLGLVLFEDADCLFFGTCNIRLEERQDEVLVLFVIIISHLFPTASPPTITMLYEQVASVHFGG